MTEVYRDLRRIIVDALPPPSALTRKGLSCIHDKYTHGLRYLVLSRKSRPEDIFTVDFKSDSTHCLPCGENIGCGHIAYMAFLISGTFGTEDSRQQVIW